MQTGGEPAILGIIERIYASVERPELWPATIAGIGELVGGRRDFWETGLDAFGGSDELRRHAIAFGTGCKGSFLLSRTDLRELDRHAAQFGALIIGFLKIIFLSLLCSPEQGEGRAVVGLNILRRHWSLFVEHDGNDPSPPSQAALRRFLAALWEEGHIFNGKILHLLAPHLDRALRLQTEMSAARLRVDMASGALDSLAIGVVLIDGVGRPVWFNRRARDLIPSENPARIVSCRLPAKRSATARSLREVMAGAAAAGARHSLAISRGRDSRPLVLITVPLDPVASTPGCNGVAPLALFISDPDRSESLPFEPLRQAFGLTCREAQIAMAVASGHGLQAAADTTGVALTTARSQLQQVFLKTGTSHQAELTALVHRTTGQLRYD